MSILSQRWEGLSRLPRIELGRLPTPVVSVGSSRAGLRGALYVKRDDLTAPLYGGNKVRKLEYLLGEALARDRDTLITSGAAGSHHGLATTLYARDVKLDTHLVLMPQRYSPHAEAHLRAAANAGAHIHAVSGGSRVPSTVASVAMRLRVRGRRPYIVPPGGSSVVGIVGHVEAGLELARQMEASVVPEPDVIYVPLGSGGTAVGLTIGLAAAGVTSPVVGVRVVPRSLSNRAILTPMIHRTVHALRKLDNRFPDVAQVARHQLRIDGSEYGGGYGVPTSEGRGAAVFAREHLDLELDPTYTAKTLAAALRRVRAENVRCLFIHTLSSAPLPEVGAMPPLPTALGHLLTHGR